MLNMVMLDQTWCCKWSRFIWLHLFSLTVL